MSKGKGKQASIFVKLQLVEDYEHVEYAPLIVERWVRGRVWESLDGFLSRLTKPMLGLNNAKTISNEDGTVTCRVHDLRIHSQYEYGTYRVALGDNYEAPEFGNARVFFARKQEELRQQANKIEAS